MARFILDENVPYRVKAYLRGRGHDAEGVEEALRRGVTDTELVRYAREDGRVIVTLDKDFIRLHRQSKAKFAAIVIRAHPPTPDRVLACLDRLLSSADVDEHPGTLILVGEREVRIETG